jgi:hypothetical protein
VASKITANTQAEKKIRRQLDCLSCRMLLVLSVEIILAFAYMEMGQNTSKSTPGEYQNSW